MDIRALLADSLRLPPGLPGDDGPVRGLAVDHRRVAPGDVFFACPGRRTHGAHHAGAALAAGARAVVAPAGAIAPPVDPRVIEVGEEQDVRVVLGRAADRFHGAPSAALDVIGITGTNGKTTVAHCVAGAFNAIEPGAPCALSGTLGHGLPGRLEGTGEGGTALTTPDAIEVHRMLAEMRRAGVRRVAMEVSSHGLDQERVAGVRFRVACLTNLSRDHLDYHASEAEYAAAKRRLFAWPGLEAAVINADDRLGRELLASPPGDPTTRRLSYALGDESKEVTVRGRIASGAARPGDRRLRLEVSYGGRSALLESPLIGRFNAYNLLASLTILIACDVPLARAVEGLAEVHAPPGRLQAVSIAAGDASLPEVFVDYAHTPDALDAVLHALGDDDGAPRGELRLVFGCGGERDRGKRRLMGEIAARGAGRLFVTSDNPRGEDPRAIIEDILVGVGDVPTEAEPDRRRAIEAAIADASPDDIVLIAGKGHEATQEIGGVKSPFDDVAVARAALAGRVERTGAARERAS